MPVPLDVVLERRGGLSGSEGGPSGSGGESATNVGGTSCSSRAAGLNDELRVYTLVDGLAGFSGSAWVSLGSFVRPRRGDTVTSLALPCNLCLEVMSSDRVRPRTADDRRIRVFDRRTNTLLSPPA